MNKTEIIKAVMGCMTVIGTGAIAGAYISSAPYTKALKPAMKACVWIGGLAIEGAISEKTVAYVERTIDQISNAFKATKEAVEIAKNVEEEQNDSTAEESV